MAHFAEIDENNIVTRVIVINSNVLMDDDGVENEQKGIDFCKALYGENTKWVQTSYNNNIRKIFAGVGFTYDPQNDWFMAPKPFDFYVFDETRWNWFPPGNPVHD